MANDIQAGSIFLREGLLLPDTLELESAPYTEHWRLVTAPPRRFLDEKIRAAGWNFFLHAALTHATALGSRGVATTTRALQRLLAQATSQDFNSLEVAAISSGHFLGVPYTKVTAHSRHLQESWLLAGPAERRRARKASDWASGSEHEARSA
jgi:hypothetical protein